MARKKVRRYRDYTQIIDGHLYAVVNLRQADGKYKKKYKKVDGPTQALQWALEELDKHKKGTSFDADLAFADFAEWYKQEFLRPPIYEHSLKVSGVKDYERLKNKVDKMKKFFGERKMSDFSENDLLRWQKHRRDKDEVLTTTLNRDFALLRAMFKKGLRFRRISSIPEFDINISAERERDRVLTFDEEKRLLAVCVAEETISVERKNGRKYEMKIEARREHLRPIIILAVDTALRLNELFTLTWADIDFGAEVISVKAQNAKKQIARKTLITPRARIELLALYEKSDKLPGSKVFKQKSPVRAFRTACARAAVLDLTFHDLRHTAITRMIRARIPHTEVMKMSGHRTLKTFLRYLNLVDSTVTANAVQLANYLDSQTVIESESVN